MTSPNYETIDDLPFLDLSAVTYNSFKWITGFFESLANQNYPLSKVRLFVRDNHSTDDTVAACHQARLRYGELFHEFHITTGSNIGFGGGHNHNLEQGNAAYFLVTNVDLEFSSDSIRQVVAMARRDTEQVASWELRQKPFEHPKWYNPVSLETHWSSSACILFRRSALEAVGGYEKRMFMYGEDVELSYRLRDHGYKLRYCPKAVCWHYSYETAGQVKPLQFFGSTLANFYIRLRYGSFLQILLGVFLYFSLFVAHPPIPHFWKGLLRNGLAMIRNAPYFLRTRKLSKESFPLSHWDYERAREGAFYACKDSPASAPMVSVVMRTYRGRLPWLREAVSSVLNQTHSRIELVVVEDGSDDAKAYMEEVAGTGTLASVIYRALPKVGRSKAGNAGLALTTGEFLVFLDDDDLFFAEHVETLATELAARPTLGATYSLAYQVSTEVHSLDPLRYEETTHDIVHRQPFSRPVLWHHNYMSIQAVLFRRALYEQHGGFDESMESLEDWNLWTRYSLQQDFLLIEKATSLYRVPGSWGKYRERQIQLDAYYALAQSKQREMVIALTPADVISYSSELSRNIYAVVIPKSQIRNILVKSQWLNILYYIATRIVAKVRAKRRGSR
ncbi:Glycosyltransferase like family 2 [Polaromonas sp. YR568]|uniref:glycosyltransferase family 2 protein n=1 Tax=Polaromonas sp. YR568 TaxID=1855301 RepID=UPI0008F37F8E|nr:glycosyltransferase family 2 protein [Polaromonas sp. YR568]SFV01856.1 Glycosyltransferase like family 2 [Polaromonas sp. YR568]